MLGLRPSASPAQHLRIGIPLWHGLCSGGPSIHTPDPPLGGALADRLHKQSTMAVLDILSALTAFLYILISHRIDPVF